MQLKSKCLVADNSGAILVECIQVKGKKNIAKIGDIIKIAIKSALPTSKIKKGTVKTALVVKTKRVSQLSIDGSQVGFIVNEVIIVEKGIKGKGFVPVSSRSTGIMPYWIQGTQLKTLHNWPFITALI